MSETITIPPHGGKLIDRVLHGEAQEEAISRAPSLRRIALNKMSVAQRQRIGGARGQLQKLPLQRLPALLQSLPEFGRNQGLMQKRARYDDVQWNVPQ